MSKESVKAAVLGARPTRSEIVEGPNGVRVEMRGMNGRDRARLVGVGINAKERDRQHQLEVIQPEVIIACAHDPETGVKLFGAEDRDALLDLDPEFLDALQAAALRVSGLARKAVEEAGKESAPTPIGASSTASPSPSIEASAN